MKSIRILLMAVITLIVCMPVQATGKAGENPLEQWVKSGVWNGGFKAKPHSSTNLSEFKTQYEANTPQWNAAFSWLASHDLKSIAAGKYPIDGTSLVVSVEDGVNEPLAKRASESHRKHIDLQYVVKGTERFALLDHASSKANCEYSEKKDVIHYDYDPAKTSFHDSTPKQFFLFFPGDWHIAKVATDKKDQNIRVVVIKLDYVQQ